MMQNCSTAPAAPQWTGLIPAAPEPEPRSRTALLDHELSAAARGGDQAAFQELARRHYRESLRVAMALLRNREEAEDEVQNAYMKAYRNMAGFREEAKFSTWMTRIVLNCCLMRLRQIRRFRLSPLEEASSADSTVVREFADPSETPEQALAHRQILETLRRELWRVPPVLRDVVVLRDIQELSMSEVALTLGISTAAAKSRLLRARQELRARMSRHSRHMGRR